MHIMAVRAVAQGGEVVLDHAHAAQIDIKPPSPFRCFNLSPDLIWPVVMRCVRYPLSLRNVENLCGTGFVDLRQESARGTDHRHRHGWQAGRLLSMLRPKPRRP